MKIDSESVASIFMDKRWWEGDSIHFQKCELSQGEIIEFISILKESEVDNSFFPSGSVTTLMTINEKDGSEKIWHLNGILIWDGDKLVAEDSSGRLIPFTDRIFEGSEIRSMTIDEWMQNMKSKA